MKNLFSSESNTLKIMGILGVIAIIIAPFIAKSTNFKFGGTGAGILLIGTYIEFTPFFSQNIIYRLLGVLVLIVIAILAIVYTFLIMTLR